MSGSRASSERVTVRVSLRDLGTKSYKTVNSGPFVTPHPQPLLHFPVKFTSYSVSSTLQPLAFLHTG